ncbi:MAG: hypothetical protein Q9213_005592 [Squamulea squamosa]
MLQMVYTNIGKGSRGSRRYGAKDQRDRAKERDDEKLGKGGCGSGDDEMCKGEDGDMGKGESRLRGKLLNAFGVILALRIQG